MVVPIGVYPTGVGLFALEVGFFAKAGLSIVESLK